MAHDWIITQLDGMAAYALANGLPALAAALRDAKLVALTELASRSPQGGGNGPPRGIN
jgi:hypothetical protein